MEVREYIFKDSLMNYDDNATGTTTSPNIPKDNNSMYSNDIRYSNDNNKNDNTLQ